MNNKNFSQRRIKIIKMFYFIIGKLTKNYLNLRINFLIIKYLFHELKTIIQYN